MRIFHAPAEVAGQVGLLAEGQRRLGLRAEAWFRPHKYGYDPGPTRSPRWRGRWVSIGEGMSTAVVAALRHDVLHFHVRSFLPDRFRLADARLARLVGPRVVVEFWGSEVRLPSIERVRNPYFIDAKGVDETAIRSRLSWWADVTKGHVVVADHSFEPFVGPYFDTVHVVPQAVDTARLQPVYPSPENNRPLVVHAPSHRALKGTEVVNEVVEQLRRQRLPFDYVEVHGMPQFQALATYRRADLVIDQLRLGSHGVFAVEMMSLGKPVVCYLQPDVERGYPPDLPIINANPSTLAAVLEDWLTDAPRRFQTGVDGRDFAESVHDIMVVAPRAVEVYGTLP